MPRKRIGVLLTGLFFASLCLRAQSIDGSISGTVSDQTRSVVPSVSIEVVNQTTGLTRTATTSGIGTFALAFLSPGFYRVSVSKEGFQTQVRRDVRLLVNQNLTFDFLLTPSAVQQSVEVTGAAPVLETTTGTIGKVIQGQEIVDMPLNGRNFTQLVLLTPGAVPGVQSAFLVQEGAGSSNAAVAGQRWEQNNYTMDGVLNNSIFTNSWAISPPPDAISEFNVQSHIVDAQFTNSSGANINAMTRSGTNSLHGALWEFFRNDKLDARNFFDTTRAPYKQNQYGATIGGPVMLPHYDGRKKNTWFFAYWEGFRSRKGGSYFASVPTGAMRNGDFSAFLGNQIGVDSLGRPVAQGAIYDLATARPNPSNAGSFLKDPFPGNRIPNDRLSKTALLTLAKYYPLPNQSVGPTVFPNLLSVQATKVNDEKVGVKIDHRFGNNDTLFGRFSYAQPKQITPQSLPTYSGWVDNTARSVALGYNHLLGPSTLLTVRYGYINTNFGFGEDPSGIAFIAATGFDRFLPMNNDVPLGLRLSVSQDFTGVTQRAVLLGPNQNHHWNADLSKVKGTHTLSAGFMYYRIHNFTDNRQASVSFARNATSLDGFTNQTGLGAASFMLGAPDSLGGWLGVTSADFKIRWYGGYLQDKWQITRKLSLNFGLRYDFVTPAQWKNNKLSAPDADSGAFLIPVAYPPLFPTPNVRPSLYDPQYNGFQPRFGFAYRVQDKTVVRGGFAIFDDSNNPMIQGQQAIRTAWPWGFSGSVPSLNRGMPSSITFDNLPLEQSFADPLRPNPTWAAFPRSRIPYAIQYNLGFQRQVTPSLMTEVNYVGSVSRHLSLVLPWNLARYPAAGPLAPRLPFPQYAGGLLAEGNLANASYNGLLAKVEKRLSYGFSFLGSYTWSKSLDTQSTGGSSTVANPYNLRAEWGPSDFDLRQMFVFSGSYELPVGKGKKALASAGRIPNALLGGWNIGTILSSTTGRPFNISAGGDVANVGGGAQRAQVVGDPGTGFAQSRLKWFNTAAFRTPNSFTYGNAGRNNMRGPGQTNLDFMASKRFSLTESKRLEFRAEFFNLPNHTSFGLPNNNVQSASFGGIFSAGTPRDIQFALKFLY